MVVDAWTYVARLSDVSRRLTKSCRCPRMAFNSAPYRIRLYPTGPEHQQPTPRRPQQTPCVGFACSMHHCVQSACVIPVQPGSLTPCLCNLAPTATNCQRPHSRRYKHQLSNACTQARCTFHLKSVALTVGALIGATHQSRKNASKILHQPRRLQRAPAATTWQHA